MNQILSLLVGVVAMSIWNTLFRSMYIGYIEGQGRLYTLGDDLIASLLVLGIGYCFTWILIRRIRQGEET